MTEGDWLAGTDPLPLLDFLDPQVSERKLRLFACACCRRVWPLLTDPRCRQAVEVAAGFADGLASVEELNAAFLAAQHAKPLFTDGNWAGAWSAAPNAGQAAVEAAAQAAQSVGARVAQAAKDAAWAAVCAGAPEESKSAAWAQFEAATLAARRAEATQQAALLREIVGNPFQAAAGPAYFTATIAQLAEALYRGLDCAFALHDALLEEGHVALAEHFQQHDHPAGCWALDRVRGVQ